jgi:hypothetical protein
VAGLPAAPFGGQTQFIVRLPVLSAVEGSALSKVEVPALSERSESNGSNHFIPSFFDNLMCHTYQDLLLLPFSFSLLTFLSNLTLSQVTSYEKQTPKFSTIRAIWRTIQR